MSSDYDDNDIYKAIEKKMLGIKFSRIWAFFFLGGGVGVKFHNSSPSFINWLL